MALSMMRHDTTKWETVKSKKGDRKKREDTGEKKKSTAAKPVEVADPAKKAFNAFDALYQAEKKEKIPRVKVDESEIATTANEVETPETPPQSQEVSTSLVDKQKEKKDKKEKRERKKASKKAAKAGASGKSAGPFSTGISAGSLKAILKEVEQRYPQNEAAQIEYVADKLLGAFRDASVGFPADLRNKSLDETTELADGIMNSKAYEDLESFLIKKSVAGTSEALAVFLRALFDASEGGVGACKDQVGLVVLVSAIARSSPVAVIRCMEEIVYEGARFTSPKRLPLLLWVFGQAERGACGSFLACWMRVLLPQLVGCPPQNPALKKGKGKKKQAPKTSESLYVLEKKISHMVASALDQGMNGGAGSMAPSSAVRSAGKTGIKFNDGGSEMQEPVVSLPALDIILSVVYSSASVPPQIAKTLKTYSSEFRQFALAVKSPAVLQAFVPLTLAFAGKSEGGYMGPGDEMVSIAAENLMTCLQHDLECFEVWAVNHKKQIKGSCRILQHLLHASPKKFTDLTRSSIHQKSFMATMRKLQDRHGFLLAQDRGWQAACAKGAHEATKKFIDGSGSYTPRLSTRGLFAFCILTGVVSAVVVAKWDDIEDLAVEFKGTEAGKKVDELLKSESVQGLLTALEPGVSSAGDLIKAIKEKILEMIN
ncbi:hypothetical protein BSKO_07876 [Bryopsis sp. KO-2023]|nr:hypothetical protein BSKO_07876 [Bryopsis sp. KO-2023]